MTKPFAPKPTLIVPKPLSLSPTPSGVPDAIISRLHAAFRAATLDPEHLAELKRYDQEVAYLDTAGFRQVLERIVVLERRWARLISRP